MRLVFNGTVIGATFATRLVPERTLLRDKADRGYGFRWAVPADGYLKLADNPNDTNAQMAALEAALGNGTTGDLQLQFDDNSPTRHSWLTVQTFTGIRSTGLTWTGEPGAQFRTFRSFSCRFEWEELFSLTAGFLLDFTETIRFDGGTPGYVVYEAVNGVPPAAFPTVALTKWTGSQTGRAVGLSQFPPPSIAPPVWGAGSPPLKTQSFGKTTPERKGDVAKYRGFAVEWSYQFEAATALPAADPNKWV